MHPRGGGQRRRLYFHPLHYGFREARAYDLFFILGFSRPTPPASRHGRVELLFLRLSLCRGEPAMYIEEDTYLVPPIGLDDGASSPLLSSFLES